MKKRIIAAAAVTVLLSSCERVLVSEPAISATCEETILEYERPVVRVSRSQATDMFIPCMAVIDGTPVTVINAAGTTLQNIEAQDISLPRLSPGRHVIELVYGKARKLYRDAEAACGERVSSSELTVEVKESPAHVLVLTAARTDIDRYIYLPDEGKGILANTREVMDIGKMTVTPDKYTVLAYPSGGRNVDFTVSRVGERVSVTKVETAIGDGIEIVAKGMLEKGMENSQFTISAAGMDYLVNVAI